MKSPSGEKRKPAAKQTAARNATSRKALKGVAKSHPNGQTNFDAPARCAVPKLTRYKLRKLTEEDILVSRDTLYDPFLFSGLVNHGAQVAIKCDEPHSLPTAPRLRSEGFTCKRQNDLTVDGYFRDQDVEVPTWRIKPLTALYAYDRTEPFDDETFAERHRKLEADEKRRKRWDLERARQQMVNKRLENKHLDATQSASAATSNILLANLSTARAASSKPVPSRGAAPSNVAHLRAELERAKRCSFRADPFSVASSVEFIEVTDALPICAFGLPLPAVKRTDFR